MSNNTLTRESVLFQIAESSIYGNLGLFIGAGMSKAILNTEWEPIALSWKELIYRTADAFEVDLIDDIGVDGASYPEIASLLAKEISRKKKMKYGDAIRELKRKISELTCWYPDQHQRAEYGPILLDLAPSWIITTNYDLILESLLPGKCTSLTPDEQMISAKGSIPIYHLHGIRTNPDSIIISQEDYISLFRPNQYRQQKLSISLKESTTLMIGYGLGDINVLTAVDWISNVYGDQRITHPHGVIQLLHKEDPKSKPYIDFNGITIVEFNDLKLMLKEITKVVNDEFKKATDVDTAFRQFNDYLTNPGEEEISKLIEDQEERRTIIRMIASNRTQLISGFLELFSKIMDECWKRTQPNGAFAAYAIYLEILFDILTIMPLSKLEPALLESIVYNLNRVAYYVGPNKGESNAAYRVWQDEKPNIPEDVLQEIERIARVRHYSWLIRRLEGRF